MVEHGGMAIIDLLVRTLITIIPIIITEQRLSIETMALHPPVEAVLEYGQKLQSLPFGSRQHSDITQLDFFNTFC